LFCLRKNRSKKYFYDDIARKAILEGQNSAIYRHAAQKHANAFWIYLIIAAVIWFSLGFWWALMPLLLAAFVAIQSVSATQVAIRVEAYEKQAASP
jgi:fatty acid desaturase